MAITHYQYPPSSSTYLENIANGESGDFVEKVRNDYTSTNVTTGAWVELIASTSAAVNFVTIFDSSGQTLELGIGAAASEVSKVYIFPGGNGKEQLKIPAGSRLAIRAVSGTADAGEISINLFG